MSLPFAKNNLKVMKTINYQLKLLKRSNCSSWEPTETFHDPEYVIRLQILRQVQANVQVSIEYCEKTVLKPLKQTKE